MTKTDRQYNLMTLDENGVSKDPFEQFDLWYTDAKNAGIDLPNAFTLSTAAGGNPSSRTLLLKGADKSGFVFYTNSLSRKGAELKSAPRAAMCFFWVSMERQVRVEGKVEKVGDNEADAYFATRPRMSAIGAWASPQGEVVNGRSELDELFAQREKEFKNTDKIPRPPFWEGYRVVPSVFEFWQGRKNRMHDRIRYRMGGGGWVVERLAP